MQVSNHALNGTEVVYLVPHYYWQSARSAKKPSIHKQVRDRVRKKVRDQRAHPFDDLDEDPIPTPQNSTPEPAYDSEPDQPNTGSRVSAVVSRQQSQPPVLPQQQANPVALRAHPASPGLKRKFSSNVMVGAHAPIIRSTGSSSQIKADQSDDDLMILDEAPNSWESQPKVKQDAVVVKREPLAVEVCF